MRKPNPEQASRAGEHFVVVTELHRRCGLGVFFAGNVPEIRGARNLGLILPKASEYWCSQGGNG